MRGANQMNYELTKNQVILAQREYQFFTSGRSGRFTTSLFLAFLSADRQSFNRLCLAYPEHGYIIALNQKGEHLRSFEILED